MKKIFRLYRDLENELSSLLEIISAELVRIILINGYRRPAYTVCTG